MAARAKIVLGKREADALMALASIGYDEKESFQEDGGGWPHRAIYDRVIAKVAQAYRDTHPEPTNSWPEVAHV